MDSSESNHKISTILVVNDAPDHLEMARYILHQAGYDVLTANDGSEGFNIAISAYPDLIMSDVLMPGMDGFELCRLIRASAELRATPILLVSALRKDAAGVVKGLQTGADDYLEAPYEPMVLIARVVRLLEQRGVNEELERRVSARTAQLEAANQSLEREIAERRQIEQQLREQAAMIELVYAAIIVRDLDGAVLYWNRNATETYGWSAQEILGKSSHTFLQTKFPIPLEELDTLLFNGAGRWQGELRQVRRDGGKIVVESRQAVVRDERGAPSAILEVNRDITERRQADEKLRESEERFRLLVNEVKDYAIYMLDADGHVASWNKGAERIKGYRADEITGQHFSCFYPVEDVAQGKPESALQMATAEGRYQDDGWRVRKDGTRFFANVVITALIDEAGFLRGFAKVTRDITEHKQTEEALRQVEERLRQSQKLEAVGQLAGGIAHDFNNLLTAILGQSQMILRQLKSDDPLCRKVEQIKKAGNRAALLTYQLLAFSRKQILQPEVLNLNAIVVEMDKILQRLIEENIEIKLMLDPLLGRIKADPGQISQIIINLMVNARDALPLGGCITVETQNVYLDEEYARRHVSVQPGHHVMLAISDTGIGMDTETQKHIFEPFFTTKGVGKGTGLGLSTVYGIVKQSGGNIWVYSEIERGTTFKIYLPRVGERVDLIKADALSNDLPRGTETILLVEDEDAVRMLAREMLESCGYKVLVAANGAEAVAICEDQDCSFDLLITDVVMPRMDGREVAERLIAMRPQLRVLFMSGYTENAIVHHGVLNEGTNFIAKPFTLEGLAHKVRELLDRAQQV